MRLIAATVIRATSAGKLCLCKACRGGNNDATNSPTAGKIPRRAHARRRKTARYQPVDAFRPGVAAAEFGAQNPPGSGMAAEFAGVFLDCQNCHLASHRY
jgi:hypothetical protein